MKNKKIILLALFAITIVPNTSSAITTVCNITNCHPSEWYKPIGGGEGILMRTYAYCKNSTECVARTQYGCDTGYYGTPTDISTGCNKCPANGTSMTLNNDDITDCFLPAGTTFTDSSGTFEYTSACFYGN